MPFANGRKRTQQAQLLAAEQGDIGDGVRARQDGEQAEDQDILQRVVHLPLLARILQIFEMTQRPSRNPPIGS